jgi:hypothetical protein
MDSKAKEPTMRRMTAIGLTAALTLTLAGTALADSFLTSVSTGSKTAAKVAGPAYTGAAYDAKAVEKVAQKALTVIKRSGNLAVALDVLQRVDSVAMDNPAVGREFRLGLAKLARSGDAKMKLLQGVNLLMAREPQLKGASSDHGIALVRAAVRQLPKDSAAHLLAGLSIAQRDAFGLGKNWDKKTSLKVEAAKQINKAQRIEARTNHPRPLVRTALRENQKYMPLYKGYKGLLK